MALDSSFGRAVFEIDITSEAVLRSKLQKNEQVIARSTDRMAQSFQNVVSAQQKIAIGAGVSAAAMGVLGATASATGNQSLAAAAQIGMMGTSALALAAAAAASGQALKGMAVAGLAFMLSPLGLALAAVAALAIGVGVLTSRMKEGEEKARALSNALVELNTQGGLASVALGLQSEGIGLELEGIKAITAEEKLRVKNKQEILAIDQRIEKSIQKQNELFKQAAFEEAGMQSVEILQSVKDSVAVTEKLEELRARKMVRGLRELADLRAQAAIKELAAKRAQEDKLVAIAREGAMRAEKARLDAVKVAAGSPLGKVLLAARDIIKDRQEKSALNKILNKISDFLPGDFGEGLLNELRAKFGLGGDAQLAIAGQLGRSTGSVSVSAFASSGAGRTGGIAGDPDAQLRKRQEKERTKAAKDSEKHLAVLARGGSTGGGGAL